MFKVAISYLAIAVWALCAISAAIVMLPFGIISLLMLLVVLVVLS